MAADRCAQCGNSIPSWAGSCPICSRIEQDRRRYGGRGRLRRTRGPSPHRSGMARSRALRRDKRESFVSSQELGTTASGAEQKQASLGYRSRLKGFNRLLKDVYGERIWLGHVLTKHGIAPEQVARWREDVAWLLRFTGRLGQILLAHLVEAVPGHDPHILNHWYGLSTPQARSAEAIALKLGITPSAVNDAHRACLRYLRGKAGRMALEKAVIIAAIENN